MMFSVKLLVKDCLVVKSSHSMVTMEVPISAL